MKAPIRTSSLLPALLALGVQWQAAQGQIPGAGAVDSDDDKFMRTASTTALLELRLAKLAQERGSRPEVRALGAQLTDSHTAMNTGIRELAGRKGVALPSNLDGSQQKVVDDLSKLTGSAFDEAFLDAMARAHQKDADEFQNAAQGASDPGLKGFAQKVLPSIKNHLSRIQALQKGGR
jgi:putative membrane protein